MIHLILEDDHNRAHYLERNGAGTPRHFTAQWNDDIHHAAHVLLTGEGEGYYEDYRDEPIRHLGRCLAEGFAYQGEISRYRKGAARGEPSGHLPPTAFVSFLQNHDQVGNRALGERLIHLCDERDLLATVALFLLAPAPPLIFMGEEFGAESPFYFFCDFGPELAARVTAGRRQEFAAFSRFRSERGRDLIPDPNLEETFLASKLDWDRAKIPGRAIFLTTTGISWLCGNGRSCPACGGWRAGAALPGPRAPGLTGLVATGRWFVLAVSFNLAGDRLFAGAVFPAGLFIGFPGAGKGTGPATRFPPGASAGSWRAGG